MPAQQHAQSTSFAPNLVYSSSMISGVISGHLDDMIPAMHIEPPSADLIPAVQGIPAKADGMYVGRFLAVNLQEMTPRYFETAVETCLKRWLSAGVLRVFVLAWATEVWSHSFSWTRLADRQNRTTGLLALNATSSSGKMCKDVEGGVWTSTRRCTHISFIWS